MRFATAQDVYMAFPQIIAGLRTSMDDTPAAEFLCRLIAEGALTDAVAVTAHSLPRRKAVRWASSCVRMEANAVAEADEELLAAAESCVRDPNDDRRRIATALSDAADASRPATWVARAAGWSGGVLSDTDGLRIICAPHLCPVATRGATLLSATLAGEPRAFLRASVSHQTLGTQYSAPNVMAAQAVTEDWR